MIHFSVRDPRLDVSVVSSLVLPPFVSDREVRGRGELTSTKHSTLGLR